MLYRHAGWGHAVRNGPLSKAPWTCTHQHCCPVSSNPPSLNYLSPPYLAMYPYASGGQKKDLSQTLPHSIPSSTAPRVSPTHHSMLPFSHSLPPSTISAPHTNPSSSGGDEILNPPFNTSFNADLLTSTNPQYHPSLDQTTVDGTLAVLEAALKAGVKRVVYASTSGTVGAFKDSRQVASDDSPYAREVVGGWPYYRAKIEAEERARGYAEQHGLELVCMRPTLILGPGDYRLSSCRTVLDIMERRIPFVPRGGLSFVDVRDVASAFIAAMQSAAPNATYLLGAVNMTLYDYFHIIARCADVAPPFLFLPPDVAWILAATASNLLPLIGRKDPSLDPVVVEMAQVYWYIEWSKAEKELGFAPRPYETTVADTVAWLRVHRKELRD
ncbi:unnamed protein product [Closterium sp. NIES-64]|nr:unnamed protein product [Closterium sp. NIES-64]CAI5995264.1 unnamed protein product [Closterium sp. NIES-64]